MNTPYRNPLHLYRALLRETTYLVDPTARTYHAEHIRKSFRRQWGAVGCPGQSNKLPSKDDTHHLKRGRKYLYMLQRANLGYLEPLGRVLKLTYARQGKRRRELIQEHMIPPAADANAEDQVKPFQIYSKGWQPPQRFLRLLKSQTTIHGQSEMKGKLVASIPEIPATTKFKKPFPEVRRKKILKQWYSKQANMLMPPLEEKEWSDLYKLVAGTADPKLYKPPARRPPASTPVFGTADNTSSSLLDVLGAIQTSAQAKPPQLSKSVQSKLGNPHTITPRFLKRLVKRNILQHSPTGIIHPQENRVVLRWESGLVAPLKSQTVSGGQKSILFDQADTPESTLD